MVYDVVTHHRDLKNRSDRRHCCQMRQIQQEMPLAQMMLPRMSCYHPSDSEMKVKPASESTDIERRGV